MYIEYVLESSILNSLTSTSVLYNEWASDTKFAFVLFDIFIIKYIVSQKDRIVSIGLKKNLHDLLEFGYTLDEGLPYSNITESIVSIIEQLIYFVSDKINSMINEVREKFDLKTLHSLCHTELYGLNNLIITIRNIYNMKIKNVYISNISLKNNILEKREVYDKNEILI